MENIKNIADEIIRLKRKLDDVDVAFAEKHGNQFLGDWEEAVSAADASLEALKGLAEKAAGVFAIYEGSAYACIDPFGRGYGVVVRSPGFPSRFARNVHVFQSEVAARAMARRVNVMGRIDPEYWVEFEPQGEGLDWGEVAL